MNNVVSDVFLDNNKELLVGDKIVLESDQGITNDEKWRRHCVAFCFMSRRNAVAAPFGSIAKKVLFRYFFYVDIIDFCALWVYTEKISF